MNSSGGQFALKLQPKISAVARFGSTRMMIEINWTTAHFGPGILAVFSHTVRPTQSHSASNPYRQ